MNRGYEYHGPIYTAAELTGEICPWCIADGSAHIKFNAEFTDPAGIGGYDCPLSIPSEIVEEVSFRTPGFYGWQQEHWLACCGDAAAYIGRAGNNEIETMYADAITSIQQECGMIGNTWLDYFHIFDKDGSPSAYIFRCLHCGKHLGYSDCD